MDSRVPSVGDKQYGYTGLYSLGGEGVAAKVNGKLYTKPGLEFLISLGEEDEEECRKALDAIERCNFSFRL